ncbi:hypothetical protein [Leptospira licerasiae]|uniref:Helix-turn-helix domain-containing protein n=1 Tax=Leptospira licerasiae str. MMD4847 TaxID=1049971 RepID=A0ABN0H9L2_9LEPT|nr:hypothetical protein [Leptospira licerasiae]EIE01490.1 hypothetical protein LEP1GSC185_3900 [Leptospira licerasiae serovar Varillal str. VAR 010]EJZ42298.1 hypothetical protein LEP1GSC178_0066 [Leptospira licerasiae str. MMD4847]
MDLEKQEVRGDYIPPEINALDYWPQMRLLLAKIAYLDQKAQSKYNSPEAGCFARNMYLANQFKIKKQTVSKYLMILKENGDINITFTLNKKGKKQRIIKSKYSEFFFKDTKNESNDSLIGINQVDGRQSIDTSQSVDSNQTPKVPSSHNNLDPTIVQKTKSNPLTFDYLVSLYGIEIFSESLRRANLQGMGTNISYINGICKNVQAERVKPVVQEPARPVSNKRDNTNQIDLQKPKLYEPTWDSLIDWSKSNLSRSSVEVLEKVIYSSAENNISISSELPETLQMVTTKFFAEKVRIPMKVLFAVPSMQLDTMRNSGTIDSQENDKINTKSENKENLYANQEEIDKFFEPLLLNANEDPKQEKSVVIKFPEVAEIQYISISNGKAERVFESGNYYLGSYYNDSHKSIKTNLHELIRSKIPIPRSRFGVY